MNLLDAMRYLVALEQHRHFGRAASACHITQPALSNAIRALEVELDIAIVRRGRAYEGLTPEGERVLASANRLLHEQELLRQDLHSGAGHPRGALTIGAVPTTMPVAARFAAQLQMRHRGIVPVVRSLSSPEIESGLENLSLDIGLGYTARGTRFTALPQYEEHYFLLRRAEHAAGVTLQRGQGIGWREAGALPLCLLTPEMHNRSIVDAAFREAGVEVRPVIETNSIVGLVLSVLDGEVCAVLPGALLTLVRGQPGLEVLPLRAPEVRTPIGFMVAAGGMRRSRALEAALDLAQDGAWLRSAATRGGLPSV
ncbi:MAG: LysR substrate-binding domain-containing protein [Pseudomonadota bacterium]